jgi:hypothetical protein
MQHRRAIASKVVKSDLQDRWIEENTIVRGQLGALTKWCLNLFILLQYISLSRQAFIRSLGEEWNRLGYAANVGSIAVFLIFLLSLKNASGRGYFRYFPDWARLWLWATIVLVCGGVLLGVLKYGYILKFVALDAVPYLLLCGMIVAGSKPEVFQYTTTVLLRFLYLALPLNIYALTDIGGLASQSGVGDRYGIESLAYETQATLAAWPLLLLLSNTLKRRQAAMVFVAVILYAGMMVLFQKRLGVAVLFVVIVIYIHQSMRHSGWAVSSNTVREKNHLRMFLMISLTVAGMMAVVGRGILAEQGRALLDRLYAKGATEYTQGAFSIFTSENERIQVVYECFNSFSPIDWAIGRGMGGAFEWAAFNIKLLQTVRAEQVINQYFLPDLGYFGRREFEIGILMPLLKGGVLLFAVLYSGIFAILMRAHTARKDASSTATFYTLVFLMIFLLHGGGFIMGDTINLVVMGLALGRCIFAINQGSGGRYLRGRAKGSRSFQSSHDR